MRAYATPADLAGDPDTGQVPWLSAAQLALLGDDAPRVLQRATEVIAENVTVGYFVDVDGNPTEGYVIAALRDACCAQIEQWMEVGEDNDIAGYPSSTFISGGGLSVNRLPPVLAPRARRVLRLAGLQSAVAW